MNTFNYSVVGLASWIPDNCICVESTTGHVLRVWAPWDRINSSCMVPPFSGYYRL